MGVLECVQRGLACKDSSAQISICGRLPSGIPSGVLNTTAVHVRATALCMLACFAATGFVRQGTMCLRYPVFFCAAIIVSKDMPKLHWWLSAVSRQSFGSGLYALFRTYRCIQLGTHPRERSAVSLLPGTDVDEQ